MLPYIDPAAMVYPLQPEIADPYDHLKRKACRRISNRWNESIIQEAKGLVMRSPWNLQDLDNNHLVINVRVQLLAGDDDLEPLIEAIVAVMTMTQFYLPRSWNHALQQLPFEKQIPLRAVFDDIEHPERNKRLHKFLATRKPFGERFKGLWSSVVDMFNPTTPTFPVAPTAAPIHTITVIPSRSGTESASQTTLTPKTDSPTNPKACHRHPAREGNRSSFSEQFAFEDADDDMSVGARSKTSYRTARSDRSRRSRFSEHLQSREGSECSQGQIDAIPALTSSLTPALTPVLTIAGILGEELSMPEPAIVKELPMPSPAA